MSYYWGPHSFETRQARDAFLEQFEDKEFEIKDEDGYRTITEKTTGLLAGVKKLHRVISASGRVWYSSWYKPEYPYKPKTLKQRLSEVDNG